MATIREVIIEPERICVGSNFKLKVKVIDDYSFKQSLIKENGLAIVNEDKNTIRSEWGE